MLIPMNATKMEANQKFFLLHEWRIYYRHHEEPRVKLHDPENETFPVPLKYVDVMRQTHASTNNVSENIINDIWKRMVSIFLRSGLGLQDSTSCVHDFPKDTSGYMEDFRKSKRLPDEIVYVLKLG